MKILLDTCALLWWLDDSPKLNSQFREMIANRNNSLFVSIASIWEIAIKKSNGKIEVTDDLELILKKDGFEVLNINFKHAWEIRKLPRLHRDPFDRMIIAQAKVENLLILTGDKHFHSYEPSILEINEPQAEYRKVKVIIID